MNIPRRGFISLIGGAFAWPVASRAQVDGRLHRVGVLIGNAETDPQQKVQIAAFKQALQQLGWIEGRNIQIDLRFGAADVDRMQVLAKEIVSVQPDVILAHTTRVVAALKRETKTLPIVFVVVSDPIGSGFVSSFPRPGGNITGFVNIEGSLGGKWLELLREVSPHLTRAAFLFNPDTAPYADFYLGPFEAAARSFGIVSLRAPIRIVEDIAKVGARLGEGKDGGLAVMPDAFTASRPIYEEIIAVAARNRLTAIYPYRFMVSAGGLLSYGTDNVDLFRKSATYIDRVLKGATPADLPVQLPTKFEFAVNHKTSKALGLQLPESFLLRADEVIE